MCLHAHMGGMYICTCACVCMCLHAHVGDVCVGAHVHTCVCLHACMGECGIELPGEGCLDKQGAKEEGGGGFLRRAE